MLSTAERFRCYARGTDECGLEVSSGIDFLWLYGMGGVGIFLLFLALGCWVVARHVRREEENEMSDLNIKVVALKTFPY